MSLLFASLTLLLAVLAFSTHIFGLPANWLILAVIAAWAWLNPGSNLDTLSIFMLVGAAVCGEVIEFGLQSIGGKKYGASRSGNWGAIVGAIAGAILGAPFFFGLGALPGSLLGAYGGCYAAERLANRSATEAALAAKGALIGKFFGLSVKMGIGVYLLISLYKMLF